MRASSNTKEPSRKTKRNCKKERYIYFRGKHLRYLASNWNPNKNPTQPRPRLIKGVNPSRIAGLRISNPLRPKERPKKI